MRKLVEGVSQVKSSLFVCKFHTSSSLHSQSWFYLTLDDIYSQNCTYSDPRQDNRAAHIVEQPALLV